MALAWFKFKMWSPGLIRALIICGLAYLIAFDGSFDQLASKLTTDEVAKWGKLEWIKLIWPMFGKPMLAALLALKAFMDDSWGRAKQQIETQTAFLHREDVK